MRPGFFKVLSLIALFFAAWIGFRLLLPLVLPFLVGLGLALGAEPMVRFLCRRIGIPRAVAVGIGVSMVFAFVALLVLLLCGLLVRELRTLAGILPNLETAARSSFSALELWLLKLSRNAPESIAPLLERNVAGLLSDGSALLDKLLAFFLSMAGSALSHVPGSALGIGTAILSGYMISAKLPRIRRYLLARFPREKLKALLKTLSRMKQTLLRFLLAQLQLGGVTLGILMAGFLILKVPYAPVWAVGVALVDAFPVLGTGTVLLPWALMSLIKGNTAQAIGLIGVYTVVTVVRSVLEPRLLGKHLGLDPLLTLMAMYAGFQLWGIPGMLLSPMLAVTAIQLVPGKQG